MIFTKYDISLIEIFMKLHEVTSTQFLTNHVEIKAWLDEMTIKDYEIHEDDSVSVHSSLNISSRNLSTIPVKFKYVGRDLDCSKNYLTTLNWCPLTVENNFDCSNNKLESLVGGPKKVGSYYDCDSNLLKSLNGAPPIIGNGHFSCRYNQLRTFEGCPQLIFGTFFVTNNPIKSLEGIQNFLRHASSIYVNNISSGGLGILYIQGLKDISIATPYGEASPTLIFEKYLEHPERIFECQEELIEAGFEAYAQL